MAETVVVANEKIAKNNKSKTPTTNEISGMYLGKQWVNVILSNPNPKVMMNV